MPPDEEATAWTLQADAAWRDEVESWPWHSTGDGGWTKSGTCTICGVTMTVQQPGEGGVIPLEAERSSDAELMERALEGPLVATDAEGPQQFFASCDCGHDHPGRPPRFKAGCGAWGWIEPPTERDR